MRPSRPKKRACGDAVRAVGHGGGVRPTPSTRRYNYNVEDLAEDVGPRDRRVPVWKSDFRRPGRAPRHRQPNSLADFHTGPVEVEHGSLAVCCCPQTIVPGETRLRLRAVGDRDARERAVLASVAPARRAHGDSAILEFSGVSCAPGEPSLVAEALGANALGATFRAAIAPGPTSCRTVVHDQATVLAYVAPGV